MYGRGKNVLLADVVVHTSGPYRNPAPDRYEVIKGDINQRFELKK